MKLSATDIPDVLLIEPKIHRDERGFFLETWKRDRYLGAGFPDVEFVQTNHSRSSQGVLRGLHYQVQHPQGKLVSVARGSVFDVAVDVRRDSPTFGKWVGCELSDTNLHQLWVPAGFAHGFCVLSEQVDFVYQCTDYYRPEDEDGIAWNDPAIGIDWPISEPVVSDKDQNFSFLADKAEEALPAFLL